MSLGVISKEGLQFFCLPANSEVDELGKFQLYCHNVIFVEVVGVLSFKDHEHEDGIFEAIVSGPDGYFGLFVGDDEVDDGLDHLALEHLLNLIQKFGQIVVFLQISIPLVLVVLHVVEILDELLQPIDFFDVVDDETESLFQLAHLLGTGLSVVSPILLQFVSEILEVEGIDYAVLPAGEEGSSGEQHSRIIIHSPQFIVSSAGDKVRIFSEATLEQHLVDEADYHYHLVGEQFQVGLDILEEIATGLGQFVGVHLAQHAVDQLVVKCLYLQSLHRLLDHPPQLPPLRLQHLQRRRTIPNALGRTIPNALIVPLRQSLIQDAFVLLRVSVDGGQSEQVLPVVLHIDGVDHMLEHHVVASLKGKFLLHLVGAEAVEVEGVVGEIAASVGGVLHVCLALEVAQLDHDFVESDPLVGVLLQAAGHYVQQFGAKTCSFLDVDEIGEDLAGVEAFKGVGEDHRVDVHSQKVDVCVLLHLPQLLAAHILEPVIGLGDELHDLEGSGVLHQQAVSDVAVV